MNPAQPQLNEPSGKGSAGEIASTNPSEPKSDALSATETAPAKQTMPTKRPLSFWEAAFYWATARR